MRRYLILIFVAFGLLLAGCGGGGSHHVKHAASRQGGVTRPANFGKPPKGDYGLTTNHLGAGYFLSGYDAVTLSYIPAGASVVGCYDSGAYPNCGSAEADFPRAHVVTVATNAGAAARCLDIESGDAVPSQAPGWARWMISRGVYRPCLYAPASEMGSVEYYLNASGVPRGDYTLWVADWDGDPGIPNGFDAKQYESNCCVDHDTFSSAFFTPAPKPKPRTICFGKKAVGNATCVKVHAEYTSDLRAVAASKKAYDGRGCVKLVSNRNVLQQRWVYFHARQNTAYRHKYRVGALKETSIALNRTRGHISKESCLVFSGRVSAYNAAAARLKKAYS